MSQSFEQSHGQLPVDRVPLLDVGRGNQPLQDEIQEAIQQVCRSGRFLYGPEVTQLETDIAQLCQVPQAVGCASGSDALLLALMALEVGPGDEVIVPSFTFFATASAVWRLGAQVVFADIDPVTYNIDPQCVERAITPRTKAMIPVHLFGQAAEMQTLCSLAAERNIAVIEDAAQAIGAEHQGRPVGSWGDIGCFSFYPTKNLGGYGDGGMLVTKSDELAQRLRLLASHGMQPRYYHSVVGINSRLDSIQAAALGVKFRHLPAYTEQRRANAARYFDLFKQFDAAGVALPADDPHGRHVWNQFTIRVPHGQRDDLRAFLAQANIGAEIYYPVPLHRQVCFATLGYSEGTLPETERAAREVLSLPIFPELTAAEQQAVVMRIAHYARQRKSAA